MTLKERLIAFSDTRAGAIIGAILILSFIIGLNYLLIKVFS